MTPLPRLLARSLAQARASFPAVVVTGPRQSGKTTFLRSMAAEALYVTFDDPVQREVARLDPRGLLARAGVRPMLLDEVQYVPDLLPYVKMAIDAARDRCGAWLLTGSQQFALMEGVSESLAGRVALLELPPFSVLELEQAGHRTVEDLVWYGGYPDLALRPEARELWLWSYLSTYVERDVRQVRDVQDLRSFESFLALVAARHGQELNLSVLATDVGITVPTARAWISVLAASYVVHLLPPWHTNLGKRLVKAPKCFVLDPALVCALTRCSSPDSALAGPLGGPLFEGLVVGETIKAFAAAGRRPAAWHWRSQDGMEVDLLVELDGELIPVEAKLTATPRPRHAEALGRFRRLLPSAGPGLVVCTVAEATPLGDGVQAISLHEWSAFLARRLRLELPDARVRPLPTRFQQ